MFNNRFYGSLNYFSRRQQDLLGNYKVSVPPFLFDETFVNVGTMKNTGFEFDLNFNAVTTKDFDYSFMCDRHCHEQQIRRFQQLQVCRSGLL